MRSQHIANTALMLIAALGFSLLAGLHAARPLVQAPELLALGFATQDICGYGEAGSDRDCPNCTLASSALTPSITLVTASALGACIVLSDVPSVCPPHSETCNQHQARAPPVFTCPQGGLRASDQNLM